MVLTSAIVFPNGRAANLPTWRYPMSSGAVPLAVSRTKDHISTSSARLISMLSQYHVVGIGPLQRVPDSSPRSLTALHGATVWSWIRYDTVYAPVKRRRRIVDVCSSRSWVPLASGLVRVLLHRWIGNIGRWYGKQQTLAYTCRRHGEEEASRRKGTTETNQRVPRLNM